MKPRDDDSMAIEYAQLAAQTQARQTSELIRLNEQLRRAHDCLRMFVSANEHEDFEVEREAILTARNLLKQVKP